MSNAIAKIEEYAIIKETPETIRDIVAENLGEGGIDPFQLDVVRVPAGGGTTWVVPSIEGEQESKELVGVIAFWEDTKAYWETGYEDSGGGTPPSCRGMIIEENGFKFWQGFGDPGIRCDTCQHNQFPHGGGRKACRDMRRIYMLRSGDILPVVIVAPPTSINPFREYFRRLVSQRIPYWGAVTKLELNRTANKSGIKYSEIVPTFVEAVPADARGTLTSYKEMIKQSVADANRRMAAMASGTIEEADDLETIENDAFANE